MNVRIVQKNETVYKNGTSTLFLRFTHERKNKFVSLAVAVYPECWDYEQQQITEEHPESQLLNAQTKGKLKEYKRKIQKFEILEIPVTLDLVTALFRLSGSRDGDSHCLRVAMPLLPSYLQITRRRDSNSLILRSSSVIRSLPRPGNRHCEREHRQTRLQLCQACFLNALS